MLNCYGWQGSLGADVQVDFDGFFVARSRLKYSAWGSVNGGWNSNSKSVNFTLVSFNDYRWNKTSFSWNAELVKSK